MRRHSRVLALLILTAAWCGSGGRVGAQPAEKALSSCEVCHSDERVAYEDSAHVKAGLTCVDCHGGDPIDAHESAMSSRSGFRPSPTRAEVPEFCASCHADRERMRPYGLPTTQFEDYRASMHGQRHSQGDMNAAVCTDCHSTGAEKGKHDILPIADTRASVYAKNLPDTCGRCHADQAKMQQYGIPTDQTELYKGSVHGQALLVGGNDAAATCVTCHGSHGALPPGIGHIGDVCGRCHQRENDLVKGSVHDDLAARGDSRFRGCVSCHGEADGGGHGITPPSSELIATACAECHGQSEALDIGAQVQTQLATAEQALEEARAEAKRGTDLGFHVLLWDDIVKDAMTQQIQSRIAQHSLVSHDVEQYTQAIESARDNIRDEVDRRVSIVLIRRLTLLPIWAFVLWSIGMLYWKRRRVMRSLHEAPAGHGEAVEG